SAGCHSPASESREYPAQHLTRAPASFAGQPLARTLAEEVLRAGTDFDGSERAPMRNSEARVTLGVTAREGDLEQALAMGGRALEGDRQSVPSLIMISRELADEMGRQNSSEPVALDYLAQLRSLAEQKSGFMPR
ncbi:hypothetical protein ACFXKM_42945, partial [Streptomyces sp. NPDC059272]